MPRHRAAFLALSPVLPRLIAPSPRLTCPRPRWHASVSAAESARAAIVNNNVMVFSATYCPYCSDVKRLFAQLGVPHCVWELDVRDDGDEIRQFLIDETAQRTVPNVFIAGTHVGGCDDTMALHGEGKLLPLISGA